MTDPGPQRDRSGATPPAAAESGAGAARDGGVGMGAFATIWLALFLDLFGFGIVIPVLPYYASAFGASPAVVALLATSFSLAQFVMSPVLGRISDQIGRRPVMLISIAGSCGSMLVLGFANTLWMVFAARVVSGVCNANVSTANAYIADRVAPEQRARYMGMVGSAIGLGFVFGPAVGGLLSSHAMPELPFLCAAGLAAVNWLMAWRLLPESRKPTAASAARVGLSPLSALGRLARVRGTPLGPLTLVSFGFYIAFSAMESTFALLTEARLSWDARHTGYLFSLVGACIAFSQAVLLGRAVRRYGEKGTLVLGMCVLTTGLVALALGTTAIVIVVGSAALALGNGLVTPSVSAIVSRLSTADDQGLNQGLVQSAAALARIVGPVGGGLLFERLSPGAPMAVGAITVLLVLAAGVPRIRLPARQRV
ncbi:MAG: MFS transporter [Nannocystaceae bacterium]|nr:MFS transporter [Nannocystaceae bacterium]